MSSDQKVPTDTENLESVTAQEQANDASEATEAESATEESVQSNDVLSELRAKLEAAEQKAQDNWEAALREKAQAENAKKRSERDVVNARKFSIEKICSELIPVLDSMEQGLALSATNDETKAVLEGMEMTTNMMLDVLTKNGVEQVNPTGELFNPEHHEAIAMQESEEHADNTVMSVFQKGYILNGRLVRPARVVVAKGSAPSIDTKA